MAVFSIIGFESGATMAQETFQASTNVPIAMFGATILSIFMGFLLIIGILFAVRNDIEGILAGPTAQPIVNIFLISFQSVSDDGTRQTAPIGAVLLTVMFALNVFFNGLNHMTVTTRIAYAMARDDAIPYSKHLSQLNFQSRNPDRIVLLVVVLESLVSMLPLVSATAFSAITSISSMSFQLTYLIPISLRLYSQLFTHEDLPKGSFNLGISSVFLSFLSFLWLAGTSIVICFPNQTDPVQGITINNLNYSPVAVGLTLLVAAAWWYLGGARKRYTGPPAEQQREQE